MTTAVAFGSLGRKRGTMKAKPSRLMTKLAIIAEISLQALMRHQYQRRIRTSAVPAPGPGRGSRDGEGVVAGPRAGRRSRARVGCALLAVAERRVETAFVLARWLVRAGW